MMTSRKAAAGALTEAVLDIFQQVIDPEDYDQALAAVFDVALWAFEGFESQLTRQISEGQPSQN
jgi:hypothetical protein